MAGILALDLATKTGWAHLARPDRPPTFGSFRIARPGCGDGKFFAKADAWIVQLMRRTHPDKIYYESPYIRGAVNLRTVLKLAGLAAIVDMEGFTLLGIETETVNPTTLKKHFTSNGRAKKPEMIAQCRRHGWDPENDNEADALAILHMAACHLKYEGWDCFTAPECCRGDA